MHNSASVPNLDDANGHKAIKVKKLRNNFKLNSIRAKLKQRTTVALYRPATHTRVWVAGRPIVCDPVVVCFSFFRVLVYRISLPLNSTSPSEPSLSPPANKKQSKQYLQCFWRCFEYLATKIVTCTKHDCFFKFPISICFEWLLVGT